MTRDDCYIYVSLRATCNPCRTVFLCAPGESARTREAAEQFAVDSDWKDLVEEGEAVLVMPLAPNGWDAVSPDRLKELYGELRNSVESRNKVAIWGRDRKLWLWETMLYCVGYGDGATYAGNVLVKHPNLFAGVALVDGTPSDFSAGKDASDHWLTRGVTPDYCTKNHEIPVHLWMFGDKSAAMDETRNYFNTVNNADAETVVTTEQYFGVGFHNTEHPAHQVREYNMSLPYVDELLAKIIFEDCFNHVIRWKNSPDGTLALVDSKAEFYRNPRFLRRYVKHGENTYDYFVHIPKGKKIKDVKGLPVVLTVHGRGEPSWLFATKNGWDTLADETGEFILVSPDSPGNIWFLPRDGGMFPKLVEALAEEFHIDRTRVYFHGFSNGAMMAREVPLAHPELFAGTAPWNGPAGDTAFMMLEDANYMEHAFRPQLQAYMDHFVEEKYELPWFFIFGDQDPGITLENDLLIPALKEAYADQPDLVQTTVMKNMPHGALTSEAALTWNYLKHFRRIPGEKKIQRD